MDETTPYSGKDRRRNTVIPSDISEAQISLMIEEEVERRVGKMESNLLLHMDTKFSQLHRLISDAFPGGDPHGHRAYHELQIKQATNWDRMKADVLSKFLTSGLWVAAGYLVFAVWESFKTNVRS